MIYLSWIKRLHVIFVLSFLNNYIKFCKQYLFYKQLFIFLILTENKCVTKKKGSIMNTVGFNPNYSTANVKSHNSTPAFKGALGDKFVSKLARGEVVEAKEVMEAVKGTFGPKSEKVADVVESLLGRVQVLTSNNEANLKGRQIAERKLADVPKQIQDAELKTATEMRESFEATLKAKNAELAAKDAELKAAKEYAAKYEPMAKVKSIEELDVVMPDQAIETLNDMVAHKVEATDSMLNFLMSGKGQEAALAQIERQNVIQKANIDGVTKIPDVEKALNSVKQNENMYPGTHPLWFANSMISNALNGNSKALYLESKAIRNQVKENAMGLLSPMCDNKYSNMSEEAVSKELDKTFDNAIKFHKNLAKGKEKLTKQYSDAEITETIVPYDNNNSKWTINEKDGNSWDVSYWQISNRGGSNW